MSYVHDDSQHRSRNINTLSLYETKVRSFMVHETFVNENKR